MNPRVAPLICTALLAAALIGPGTAGASGLPPPASSLSPLAALGKALFFDHALSASGRLACSSCHDPANAYAAPESAGPVMAGGANGGARGLRTVPSLRYLQNVPRFTRHLILTRHAEPEDVGPGGGLTWDGRADRLEEQPLAPLLDPREMANANVSVLAVRLRACAESAQLQRLAGAGRFASDATLAQLAARALARFQLEDPSFHPFDSRFDDYLRGTGTLSAAERRGLALFNSPQKGNCAECHTSAPGPGGRPPVFTDYRFAALGVPRNPALVTNLDPAFHDLGLCGPYRRDLERESRAYCGLFRTPGLRNVARRHYYFHNGRFTSLEDVLRFYVTRDLQPARWYPSAAPAADQTARVVPYDDLPPADRINVDRRDAPLDRRPGEAPALTEAEMADVIAFLKTLDDRS